ncbi:undecaprenyl-diphosphate phosphatase [Candidatus Pacearchaeota archaeon]|nr:undecaprenyl-diphosphate phosphatase [Candidatus Pacearchaeota archaeon]
MEDLWVLVVLGIVQGITEWLPVSSSTHIGLVSSWLGIVPTLSVEVALHLGTLMAVFVYFGNDIVSGVRDLLLLQYKTASARLLLLVGLASIPAGLVGYTFHTAIDAYTASFAFAGGGLLITSLLLSLGSRAPRRSRPLTVRGAFLIGCVQVLSLLRGISRSGSTFVPGLWLGLNERDAIRFSFLLSIPIIIGASLVSIGNQPLPSSLFLGTLVSFGVGLGGIHFFFTKVLHDRKNLRWFAVYTGLLGLGIVVWSFLA